MNDHNIYELMAKTPNIRAVQICDALDEDLPAVSAALRSLVDVGHVVKHADFGANGRQVQVYNLSDEFKQSREGKALLASMASAPAPAAAPAPEPAAAPAPVPKQPASNAAATPPVTTTGGRKPDRAVAYLVARGTATDDELRAAMGILKPYTPLAYLGAAVKGGRLHKDKADGKWRLGRAPAEAASTEPEPTTTPSPSEKETTAKPGPIKRLKDAIADFAAGSAATNQPAVGPRPEKTSLAAVCEVRTPASEAAPAASYRCALWSDGVLEVRKDGETVAEMPQAAGESLAAFLARLTQLKEAA